MPGGRAATCTIECHPKMNSFPRRGATQHSGALIEFPRIVVAASTSDCSQLAPFRTQRLHHPRGLGLCDSRPPTCLSGHTVRHGWRTGALSTTPAFVRENDIGVTVRCQAVPSAYLDPCSICGMLGLYRLTPTRPLSVGYIRCWSGTRFDGGRAGDNGI